MFSLPLSIGLSLTDTLDDLINDGRIEPQLAMKVLSNFDRVITEALAEKAKAKLSFKVLPLVSVIPLAEGSGDLLPKFTWALNWMEGGVNMRRPC